MRCWNDRCVIVCSYALEIWHLDGMDHLGGYSQRLSCYVWKLKNCKFHVCRSWAVLKPGHNLGASFSLSSNSQPGRRKICHCVLGGLFFMELARVVSVSLLSFCHFWNSGFGVIIRVRGPENFLFSGIFPWWPALFRGNIFKKMHRHCSWGSLLSTEFSPGDKSLLGELYPPGGRSRPLLKERPFHGGGR